MGTKATGRLVSEIRRESELSQEALAQQLGVSFATVNSWERGRSTPRLAHRQAIEKMARGLGLKTDLMVLVIDDDPAACLIIEGLVSGSPIPAGVETTTSQSKGLILCGALQPDLLLLDVMMPGMDGFEVARQLADLAAAQMPVIVFVTAATDFGTEMRATELGHQILHKPLRQEKIDDLLSAVAEKTFPSRLIS